MARDSFHPQVKAALLKTGWTITQDPLRLETGGVKLEVDLAAERMVEGLIAADRNLEKIVLDSSSDVLLDRLNCYRDAVKEFLLGQCGFQEPNGVVSQAVFDEERDQYLLLSMGWRGQERVYGVVMHLEIRGGKVWIQCNQTELDLEAELVALGVGAGDFVRGLVPPEYRVLAGLNVA